MDVHQISPQYLTQQNQIVVTILDIINPAHYVVREVPDVSTSSSIAKNFLEAEYAMQKYYASVQPCLFQLPLKDTIIVVSYENKFYRAKVLRILNMSAGHLFRVYLLDYGLECTVPRNSIYEIEKDFLIHPFQAVNMKLLGLEPISMIMNPADLSLTYGPVSEWDPSTDKFICGLKKEMFGTYIEVQGFDNESIYGRLYITYETIPAKCINDQLISNTFARFNEDCCKNVKKLENNGGTHSSDSEAVESMNTKKSNSDQMSSTPEYTEFKSDFTDFKMRLINPEDGKVVAESSLNMSPPKLEAEVKQAVSPSEIVEEFYSPDVKSEQKTNLVAEKTFQKLQQLNRRKRAGLENSQSTTENRVVLKSAAERTQGTSTDFPLKESKNNSNNIIPARKSIEDNHLDNSNSNLNDSHTAHEDNFKQEETSQAQAQKRFLKLQQLSRKQLRSPILCGNSECAVIKSPPAVNENVPEEKDTSLCLNKMEISTVQPTSVENEKNNNSGDESSIHKDCDNSHKISATFQLPVSGSKIQSPVNNSRKENLSEAQVLAQKKFLKLQQLSRKRLQSPIHCGDSECAVIKSPPAVNENVAEEKDTSLCLNKMEISTVQPTSVESEKNNNLMDESSIHKDCDNYDQIGATLQVPVSDGNIQSPVNNSRQENTSEILENVKTLQRLQNRIRLKKMKESPPKPEKTLTKTSQEELIEDKSAIKSSTMSLVQLENCSSSSKSAGEI